MIESEQKNIFSGFMLWLPLSLKFYLLINPFQEYESQVS